MTWFLVALVTYAGSDDTYLKINTSLKFRSLENCQTYHNTHLEGLQTGLKQAFPETTNMHIQCVDQVTTQKMQKKMLERDSK